MLVRLARLIRERLLGRTPPAFIAAHLGDDHFVVALPPGGEARLEELISVFDSVQSEFFSTVDYAARGFHAVSTRGDRQTLALTSPRVVHLPGALREVSSVRELYAIARDVRERSREENGDPRPRLIVKRLGGFKSDRTVA
jgi:hypothetical protein